MTLRFRKHIHDPESRITIRTSEYIRLLSVQRNLDAALGKLWDLRGALRDNVVASIPKATPFNWRGWPPETREDLATIEGDVRRILEDAVYRGVSRLHDDIRSTAERKP